MPKLLIKCITCRPIVDTEITVDLSSFCSSKLEENRQYSNCQTELTWSKKDARAISFCKVKNKASVCCFWLPKKGLEIKRFISVIFAVLGTQTERRHKSVKTTAEHTQVHAVLKSPKKQFIFQGRRVCQGTTTHRRSSCSFHLYTNIAS